MPVLLDTIPEKAAKVPRPDTRRWLLFLAFVMSGGFALTLWNWTTERTGFIFWFTALGLPFCLWGLLFSLRRFAYKAEQVGLSPGMWSAKRLLSAKPVGAALWLDTRYIRSTLFRK